MFIDVVPNRSSPPAVLLREAYRDENGRPQKRTLANLSKLPAEVIETLKALLKGGALVGATAKDVSIERSLPHGHEGHATGRSAIAMSAAMREALGELAEAQTTRRGAVPAERLVIVSGPS